MGSHDLINEKLTPMGSTQFINPRAPLVAPLLRLGRYSPGALGFLNPIDPLVSVSNYHLKGAYNCLVCDKPLANKPHLNNVHLAIKFFDPQCIKTVPAFLLTMQSFLLKLQTVAI